MRTIDWRPILRKTALGVVGLAGIASIMATSPPPAPYHFRSVDIRPSYRCPGADVAVSWTLSLPAPVTVTAASGEALTTSDGGTVLPAELLDRAAPVAAIELRIGAEDAEAPWIDEITTLDGGRTVEELAFHARGLEFRTSGREAWDERARITRITLEQVRDLDCSKGAASPPAWKVVPPSGPSFLLRAADGYSASPGPASPAGGIWRLRPEGGECRLPSSGLEPYLSIRFTAACPGGDGAS